MHGDTAKPKDIRPFRTFERLESEVRSYSRSFPAIFDRAEGAWLYTRTGNKYLDFLSGCSSLNYGHNHPALKERLIRYIEDNGITHSLDMHSAAKSAFLEAFEEIILKPRDMKYKMQFPGPTGANAVEAALKLSRKITGRTNVIAFTNGFHGVTLGALAATGNAHHRGGAGVPLSGVTRAAFDGYFGSQTDTALHLERMLDDPSSGLDDPAAIIVETVQGEGGLNVCSAQWLQAIQNIARKHGALFIVDDIQAGCGRTGPFFSFEGLGIQPDIITLAKSFSGMGLPLAAVLIRPDLDIWKPGEHNGTFRGNCHAFITARAALEVFWRDDFLSREVRRKGELLNKNLCEIVRRHHRQLRGVKGRGMMQGIDVGSGKIANEIVKTAFARGLVIETSGGQDEIIKVLAPLTIYDADLQYGLDVLAKSVSETLNSIGLGSAA